MRRFRGVGVGWRVGALGICVTFKRVSETLVCLPSLAEKNQVIVLKPSKGLQGELGLLRVNLQKRSWGSQTIAEV